LDVQIPDDLLTDGWIWHGSTLHWPATDMLRGISITTCTYPPPPYPSERGSCFDCARRFTQMRAERRAREIEVRVAKATKTKLPKVEAPAPELAQMELF